MLINDLKISLGLDKKKYIFLCSFTREFYDFLTQANVHFCNLNWMSGKLFRILFTLDHVRMSLLYLLLH